MTVLRRFYCFLALLLIPRDADAGLGGVGNTVTVDIGPELDPGQIVMNLISVLDSTILYVAVATFIVGALLYVTSGGKDDRKSMGKDFMIGSITGVVIVKAAKTILNLTMYFIYGT